MRIGLRFTVFQIEALPLGGAGTGVKLIINIKTPILYLCKSVRSVVDKIKVNRRKTPKVRKTFGVTS